MVMDIFEVIEARRSVRMYSDLDVEEEKLLKILHAADRAPSAGNLQSYEIYLIRNPAVRGILAAASLQQEFISKAPVTLVFCANQNRAISKYRLRGKRLYALQDATIACTFAMLTANALGLATVWVGAFEDDKIRLAIGAPEGVQPVALLPIGYAAECPAVTPRRPLSDLVHRL
jgi:nitroreductase